MHLQDKSNGIFIGVTSLEYRGISLYEKLLPALLCRLQARELSRVARIRFLSDVAPESQENVNISAIKYASIL